MSDSLIPRCLLRDRLANGGKAVGTMLAEFRQRSAIQCLENAGFDWVILDNEHGIFSAETLADLSQTARRQGVTPIVRVPAVTYEHVARALDGGAQGVMLPRIESPEEVRAAVSWCKYPPEGRRGSALGRGHTDFKSGDVVTMMADANREVFVVVQIETTEALAAVEEIAAVPGVDALLVGPNDLSIALGVPGQLGSPVLHAAIERTLAACLASAVAPGIHTNAPELTAHWGERGMRLLSVGSEVGFLQAAATAAVRLVRGPSTP